MYAQLSYKQFVGDSKLTVSEAGCYVTAFANTLEKVGVHVDPPTLNTFFTTHNVYTYDKTDRANDDLYWNSGTRYCPQLVVAQIGGAGFPNLDLAIVEFHYRSVQHPTLPNGQPNMITHFCAVNHAGDHSIIDSWDGKVKTPAEYEHVYGQPIAWATYVFHTVQTTPVSLPPAAPVSAPKAQAPSPQPPAPAAPRQIVLPKTDHYYLWHVYPIGGPYTLPHAIHVLDPYHYGPLTYDILGNPAPNIYLIKTQDFGEVAIYAGPDTVAQFPGSGHGEGETTGVPVSEVVPAPVSTPAIAYDTFPASMQLVTKEGAKSYNFASGMAVENFQPETPFEAVGKATVTLADGGIQVYFMDSKSFRADDETQRQPIGVKTADLSPAAKPEPASGTNPTISQSSSTASSAPITTSSTALSSSTPADVQPKAINSVVSWQNTFEPIVKGDSKTNPQSVDYIVIDDMTVYDFSTGNDRREVTKNALIPVVGTFIFAGRRYYLAESSFKKGTWYGFPVASLRRQDASTTPFNTGDDINQLDHEHEIEMSKARYTAIKARASADGLLSRFRRQRSHS